MTKGATTRLMATFRSINSRLKSIRDIEEENSID